jgi:hypothetical protein
MAFDKYLKLKRIYARVYHLYNGFNLHISDEIAKSLDYDFLKIAQYEESKGLLDYIRVDL